MSLRIDEAHSQLFASPLGLVGKQSEENSSEMAGPAAEEQTGASSPDQSSGMDLEAQQKAFQRFASGLGLSGFRTPFNMNCLPPFLAALQGNPLSIQQQLLGLTSGLSGVSPGPDDDDDVVGATEPEDLTFRKDVKEEGGSTEHSNGSGAPTWSYEEQFKQLYELNDDPKRKEWLDDWLSFMHRIGKPVTRIPIMAKQVLDLYELYRLVVQHGGLVEIINKKLWREITKGLNLPSSITSAAFTLRTQYQKYLYDYECEKEGLSNPSDLQAAIDGNRREGRRTTNAPSFAPLGYGLPHPAANLLGKHLNGLGMRNDFMDDDGLGIAGSHNNLFAAYRAEQLAMLEAQQRQLERAQRAAVEAVTRHSLATMQPSGRESTSSMDSEASPAKRARLDNDPSSSNPTSSARELKISTRKSEGQQGENSMVVSMEINGITYQGVLFALDKDKSTAEA